MTVIQKMSERRRGSLWRSEKFFAIVTLFPALAIISLFTIYPVIDAFWTSFTYYDFSNPLKSGFAGLSNYHGVLTNLGFQHSVLVTAIFVPISLIAVLLLAMGTALLLNEKFRGVKYLQLIALLPWAIPYVVAGLMWRWIDDPNYGILNFALKTLGLIPSYQSWFTQPAPAMVLLIVTYVWTEYPFSMLLILAGLQSVPKELYEAAVVDGAKSFARFRRITFEWLRPILLVVIVYETLRALTVFDIVYVLTQGQPADATALISYYIYRFLFTFYNVGQSNALSVIVFLVSAVLIYAYFKFLRVGGVQARGR